MIAFDQVPNMPKGRFYQEIIPEVRTNGFGLGGGFDNQKVFGHKGFFVGKVKAKYPRKDIFGLICVEFAS